MSEEQEIELDMDTVFPRIKEFHNNLRPRTSDKSRDPPPLPPPRTAIPPPATKSPPEPTLARLQEDIDLMIEATKHRLDDMEARQTEFERILRAKLNQTQRHLRKVEHELGDTRHTLRDSHHRRAELTTDLSHTESRADELHAHSTVAIAHIKLLKHAQAKRTKARMLESDLRPTEPKRKCDPTDSTTKIMSS